LARKAHLTEIGLMQIALQPEKLQKQAIYPLKAHEYKPSSNSSIDALVIIIR